MLKIAVLLTVFNRKNVTLIGLEGLYKSMAQMSEETHQFDIYMTDDGCTDGTAFYVKKEFPDVHIIQGDGSLYWCGGMRKAWLMAVESGVDYDYFIWFNDDAELFPSAITQLFMALNNRNDTIVCGAFRDHDGNVSYGCRDENMNWIRPGEQTKIKYMNGNLVLISRDVFKKIGSIDSIFIHSFGDWDYGLRALKNKVEILLTNDFVGVTDRHDTPLFDKNLNLVSRIKCLYNPIKNINKFFIFNVRHRGSIFAIRKYIAAYFYVLFPFLLKK